MTLSRRRGVNPVSVRRRSLALDRAEVREAVFERDGSCLLYPRRLWGSRPSIAGKCGGGLRTAHHLVKASQGGAYDLPTLVTLCAFHNSWVEDYPDLAHAWGLVVRRGEWVGSAWVRLQLHGLVQHWWDGTPDHMPMPELTS